MVPLGKLWNAILYTVEAGKSSKKRGRDEGKLLGAGEVFYGVFHFQGAAEGGVFPGPDEFDRAAGAGVAGAGARVMFLYALFEIRGITGVQRAVAAADDINVK